MLESNATPLSTVVKAHIDVSSDDSDPYLFVDGSCPGLSIKAWYM